MSEAGAAGGAAPPTGGAPAAPGGATASTPSAAPAVGKGQPANDNGNAQAIADAVDQATGGEQDLFDLKAHGDKLVELVINGETVKMPLRDAMRDVMRSKAAYKKMEEAAVERRRAQQTLEAIRANPGKAIAKLGGPAGIKAALKELIGTSSPEERTAVEETFAEIMRDAQRPKEELERESLAEERARLKKEREDFEQQKRDAQIEQAAKVERRKLERSFKGALEKAGLSADPETMGAMSQAAAQLLEYGLALDEHGIAECAAMVREEHDKRSTAGRARLKGLSPEQLAAELGEDTLKALRQWDLSRVAGAPPQRAANDNATPPPPKQQPKRWKTTAEVARELEEERRAGKLKF